MFKRIHIKNFRSCQDVVLDDLGSMTALVGRNGSGKTNILKAIDTLARSATSTNFVKTSGRGRVVEPSFVTADIECDNTTYRYSLGTKWRDRSTTPDTIRNRPTFQESLAVHRSTERWDVILDRTGAQVRVSGRAEPIKIGPVTPCLSALTGLLPEETEFLKPIESLLQFLRGVRYYAIDESNESGHPLDWYGWVPAEEYQKWLTEYQSTGETGDSVVVRLLHAFYERRPKFDELFSLLGPRGLGLLQEINVGSANLPFEQPERDANPENPQLYIVTFRPGKQLGGGRKSLAYGNLSLGTRRVVHLLTALILDDSSLKLIEHPEDGIHRGLVRKLIGLLRANADPAQIMLSSHSAVVLNELAAEDIRLVYIQGGSTKVRALTPKEVRAASGFIEEEGTLAEFLETVEG